MKRLPLILAAVMALVALGLLSSIVTQGFEDMAEAEAERQNADDEVGIVVHKPHGTGLTDVGNWHVVLTLDTFIDLVEW